MKKSYLFLLLLLLIPFNTYALNSELLSSNTASAVLVEESTGKILYERNKDKKVSVASMTKMMAQILILESIEKGKIKWDDIITISKNAAGMGGSQIYLQDKEKMSIRDLMKGISMASANDATVAMAEHIAGSEEEFVKLMNKKAKELNLKNTMFKNSTGLDEEGHYSSAYDMALIARELLTHNEILKFSSVYEDYLRKDTPNKFWLVNTNKLIRFYDSADGLKTGHTDNAKYCIAATAKRNGLRIIAIVLGSENAKIRNEEATNLLDYGFNNTKYKIIYKKTDSIKKIKINNGNKLYITAIPKYDVTLVYKKNEKEKNTKPRIEITNTKLPIKKGDIIGSIKVANNKIPLISKYNINKLTFIKSFLNNLKSLVY